MTAAAHRAIPLPGPLARFLASVPYACLMHNTTIGSCLIVKIPRQEIDAVRGRVPVSVSYELHRHPAGPVIRLVLTIHDHLRYPLMLETFVNPADLEQAEEFADLVARDQLHVLFYDQELKHRLSKIVTQAADRTRDELLPIASRLLMEVPPANLNFDRAKRAVMEGCRV